MVIERRLIESLHTAVKNCSDKNRIEFLDSLQGRLVYLVGINDAERIFKEVCKRENNSICDQLKRQAYNVLEKQNPSFRANVRRESNGGLKLIDLKTKNPFLKLFPESKGDRSMVSLRKNMLEYGSSNKLNGLSTMRMRTEPSNPNDSRY